ncbi:MAG: hypothetical protein ABFD08_07995 [Syntrophomonas sp.]
MALNFLLDIVRKGRLSDGKSLYNYLVVNTDESYAGEVADHIEAHERAKGTWEHDGSLREFIGISGEYQDPTAISAELEAERQRVRELEELLEEEQSVCDVFKYTHEVQFEKIAQLQAEAGAHREALELAELALRTVQIYPDTKRIIKEALSTGAGVAFLEEKRVLEKVNSLIIDALKSGNYCPRTKCYLVSTEPCESCVYDPMTCIYELLKASKGSTDEQASC